MKKKSSISLGPGASSLILIFVVLSLSVLAMLSLLASSNDLRLSRRSVQVIESVYSLQAKAEERRAEIDGILAECAEAAVNQEEYLRAVAQRLPDEIELDEATLNWVETDGARELDCALTMQPLEEMTRTLWLRHNLYAQTEETWN